MSDVKLAMARSQALFDWKDGVHENPYPPGPEQREYERVMDELQQREDAGVEA